MPPKKDPMAPVLTHEDCFTRTKKMIEAKVAPKEPKGDYTQEELSIPPQFQTLPELKNVMRFYNQGEVVRRTDPKALEPSRLNHSASDRYLNPRPRKEVQDLFKHSKTTLKAAEKRTAQFLKQLTKAEQKQAKRDAHEAKIEALEEALDSELREAKSYSEKRELFLPKWSLGSKFGDRCPKSNVWIVAETTDATAGYCAPMVDEITKFINSVIDENCESFNLAVFGNEEFFTTWVPAGTFQCPQDPKKGTADALKWIAKQLAPKNCQKYMFPADWTLMLRKCIHEMTIAEPSSIYLACSKPPPEDEARAEIAELMAGKGVPLTIVSFDETLEEDEETKQFLLDLGGHPLSDKLLVDTSLRDLGMVDKMLTGAKTKKKQLEKLKTKLGQMEDLSGKVKEYREALNSQISIETLLRRDFEVLEGDSKAEEIAKNAETGQLVLPETVQASMAEQGYKLQV